MVDWFSKRPNGHARPTRHSGRPAVAEITPELLIGEYPRDEDVDWLKDTHSVTAVLNLQDEEDLRVNGIDIDAMRERYAEHGIKLVRTPIPDGSADEMKTHLKVALDDLHELIDAHERVFLHCNGGVNRAPTLAIAYLRAFGRMSLNEAQAHVKTRRACGPFMTVLEEYFGPRDLKPDE
ncbi:MAG TPA: dual specificity protein phosphatase family protein [Candidatus Binataceae bacterium]|jgi:protein-tyrosine phosphatase